MPSDFDMTPYLGVFLEEAEEQIQVLNDGILLLEKDQNNLALLNKVFRAAHTLKGSSAAMGFHDMADLTHEMENILDRFRQGKLAVNREIIDLLLACLDFLQLFKKEILGSKIIDADDVQTLTEKLKNMARTQIPNAKPNGEIKVLNETEQQAISLAQEQGSQVLEIQVTIIPECQMKAARAYIIYKNLNDYGEIIKANPAIEELETERFEENIFKVLFVTGEEINTIIEAIKKASEVQHVTIKPFAPETTEEIQTIPRDLPRQEGEVEKRLEPKISQTVRVEVQRLDFLLNLVGELVIDRTRLVEIGHNLRAKLADEKFVDTLEEVSLHIGRITGELQGEIMKARMFPIEQLFQRFPRMVRDLAQKAGKEVNFLVEGRETELDRTVIEEIADPLIHLLRNAVDHGIEKPEIRQSKGKTRQGTIKLSAFHQENQIMITLEDDGQGIDAQKIRLKAERTGILSPEESTRLTDQEVINLIFTPGFSTAESISEISGRGVGMDIVRNHLEKINGIIEVDTRVERGTLFTIKLPLTLAINRSLLVKVGQQVMAFPLTNIIEVMRRDPQQIRSIQQDEVILVRGEVLPLFHLAKIFEINNPLQKTEAQSVVIVGYGEKHYGFVVDALIGEQEIVIKSLGEFIGQIPGLAGSTILGDGRVALILDILGLINLAKANLHDELAC